MNNDVLYYSIIASASLSLVACCLLLIAIIMIKELKSLSYKLIAYLCVTDMITSIGNFNSAFLIPTKSLGDLSCNFQAYLVNFSILSSILFTSVILHFLHWSIVQGKAQSKTLEISYLLFAWFFPLVLSIFPLIFGAYGQAGGWCWISGSDSKSILFQIVDGFGVILLVIVYNIVTLIKINKKLKIDCLDDTVDEGIRGKLMKRLIYYPIVLIICILPAALHRGLLLLKVPKSELISVIAADFQCLLGLGNCIVYGFTDNLKKRIKKKINRLVEADTLSTLSKN